MNGTFLGMSFSVWMVLIPGLCYVAVASEQAIRYADWPTVLIYLGYVQANVGFMWKFWQQANGAH